MSFKMDQKPQVAVAVFGDAAIEEGVLAESINFAVTKNLPVLFVCENNLYSTHSPLSVRQPASDMSSVYPFRKCKPNKLTAMMPVWFMKPLKKR